MSPGFYYQHNRGVQAINLVAGLFQRCPSLEPAWLSVIGADGNTITGREMPVRSHETHFHLSERGFTLLELSMVLVIVSLIIGGVLVGRDLIYVAAIRAQLSQYDKLHSAILTFEAKYSCLPGDCPNAIALGLGGLYNNSQDNGNGDGLIGDGNSYDGATYEPIIFFWHLHQAGLISEPVDTTPADKTFGMIPGTWIGSGWYASVISHEPAFITTWLPNDKTDHKNHLILGRLTLSGNGTFSNQTALDNNLLLPSEAQAIDTKIDDGMPFSGNVRAAGWIDSAGAIIGWNSPAFGLGSGQIYDCVNLALTNYNSVVNTSTRMCALQFEGFQ